MFLAICLACGDFVECRSMYERVCLSFCLSLCVCVCVYTTHVDVYVNKILYAFVHMADSRQLFILCIRTQCSTVFGRVEAHSYIYTFYTYYTHTLTHSLIRQDRVKQQENV